MFKIAGIFLIVVIMISIQFQFLKQRNNTIYEFLVFLGGLGFASYLSILMALDKPFVNIIILIKNGFELFFQYLP